VYLRTLGHPALERDDGSPVDDLRTKDLALLVYLCVRGPVGHSRGHLAALLWRDSDEAAARHSLTQALRRVGQKVPDSLVLTPKEVRWAGTLPCDAVALLRHEVSPADVDEGFSLYRGPFLEGFDAGRGAEDYGDWVHHRREELRNAALQLLEKAGDEAAAAEDWTRMRRLGERAEFVDPGAEAGRRLVMRALAASGECNQALRYYDGFAEWLKREYGAEPDPETRALAEKLRAEAADPPQPVLAVHRAPAPAPSAGTAPSPGEPLAPADPPHPARDGSDPSSPPADAVNDERAATRQSAGGSPPLTAERTPPARPARTRVPPRAAWIVAGALLLVVGRVIALELRPRPGPRLDPVRHGESVRVPGSNQVYLAFAQTLYAYPDTATLRACTGPTPAIREVSQLPAWPHRRLPSAILHPWMGDTLPVKSADPEDLTAFVAVGCILAGVPTPPTLDSIFGPAALKRLVKAPRSVLRSMPHDVIAYGQPVRPVATLIRSPDGSLRWITYHGGALAVTDSAVLATWCRTPREAMDVSEDEFRYYHPFGQLHPGTTPCRRGR
jgi:DNA-binding SARP family transcriptional activator